MKKLQRLTRLLLVGSAALFALAAYAPLSAHHDVQYPYTFFDVGTLGGPQTYHEFPGTVLNNRSMLALFGSDIPALDPYHDTPSLCFNQDCHRDHAAVWQSGSFSGAYDANNRGQVVGVAENALADPFHGDQGVFNSLPGTNQDRAFLTWPTPPPTSLPNTPSCGNTGRCAISAASVAPRATRARSMTVGRLSGP